MPRPHLEFVQYQALPWEAPAEGGPFLGARRKTLSLDSNSRAFTSMMSFPRGQAGVPSCYIASDCEVYVLEGDLSVNGVAYESGDYAYFPAGFLFEVVTTQAGGHALVCVEGPEDSTPSELPGQAYESDRLIAVKRTAAMPWEDVNESKIAGANVGIKILRLDPITEERTWLLNIDVDDSDAPFEINGIERHPCVEECFLIKGDMAMTQGTMTDGAYFWRPPMIPHGPMGTRKGFFGFFRSKEGAAFSTEWSDAPQPIDWEAPYRPVLPGDVAALMT